MTDLRSYTPSIDLDALQRRLETPGGPQLSNDEQLALIATARMGKAIWSLGQKYGLKHRAGCPLNSDADVIREPCNCGLFEEVTAALKGNRA